MCRRSGSLARAWALAACLLSVNVGCALHRCHFDRGEALGLHPDCDPHSPRVYHHNYCCGPFRDPRMPGPRIVSTLPAVPEMAADDNFCPVPTYPVFGPRSEEPDGFDPQMLPLLPAGEPMDDGEPLGGPALSVRGETIDAEEFDEEEDTSDLRLAAPAQSVEQAGWKPARNRPVEETASRPCATCRPNFKRSAALRR